ncbi:MAG TPA: phosphatase PAP2 family protein [Pirellulaceae bacterium]|nr:phosphatase PAP2 family protein [Pirellulaceae bacterium]
MDSPPPIDRSRSPVNWVLACSLLGILAISAVFTDFTVTSYFLAPQDHLPGDLRRIIAFFEVFGHGAGVCVILLAVAVLDRPNIRSVLRLATCAFGAGIVNVGLKLLIGRTRPNELWLQGTPASILDSFHGFAPALQAESWRAVFDRSVQSFPSGHSATAAGLAMGLAWLYPQGRWFFLFLAAMTMLQRVVSGAHYTSDTLAGAAVGVLVASLCCDRRWLGWWFDRIEGR